MNHEIAILSLSKRVKLEDVMAIADACNKQAAEHVCPAWGVPYRPINVYSDPTTLPPLRTDVCTLHDEAGEAGVLGYHSMGITPFARIFAAPILDNGGVVLCDSDDHQRSSLAAVFSHELSIEMTVDPGCDQYALDAAGREVDLEPGDPFQTQQYTTLVRMPWGDELVAVSDFAMPSWFKTTGKPPYNWMGDEPAYAGKSPFQISQGGYVMINGDPVFARRADGTVALPPAWWLAMRPPGKRRLRRGPVARRIWTGAVVA